MKVKPLPGDGLWKCSYRDLPIKFLNDPVYFQGVELVYDSVPGPEYAFQHDHTSNVHWMALDGKIWFVDSQGVPHEQGDYQSLIVQYAEILNEPHRSIR